MDALASAEASGKKRVKEIEEVIYVSETFIFEPWFKDTYKIKVSNRLFESCAGHFK